MYLEIILTVMVVIFLLLLLEVVKIRGILKQKPVISQNTSLLNTNSEDELLLEAKEVIVKAGRASTSLLQQRLAVGYARAAKILDILEEMGVVGPSNGSKSRAVLKKDIKDLHE